MRTVMGPSSESFSASVERPEDQTVVFLHGELDMDGSPQLAELLAQFLDGESQPQEIILDLSGLSFIDSSGLSVLLTAQTTLNGQDRRLIVRSPRPNALKVFEITDVVDFLNIDLAEVDPPRPPN